MWLFVRKQKSVDDTTFRVAATIHFQECCINDFDVCI